MKKKLVGKGQKILLSQNEGEGGKQKRSCQQGLGVSADQMKEGCGQTFGFCALFVDGLLQWAAEDFVTLSTKGGPFTPYIRRVDGVLP